MLPPTSSSAAHTAMSRQRTFRPSTFALALGLLTIAAFSPAAAQNHFTLSFDGYPAIEGRPFTVTVEGVWNSGCVPVFHELRSNVDVPENDGAIYNQTWGVFFADATVDDPGAVCPAVQTPYSSSFTFHSLPAGVYGLAFTVLNPLGHGQEDTYFVLEVASAGPADVLPLQHGRFEATATWKDFAGRTVVARALPGASGVSGQLWFFSAENPELTVKVLDGCAINGHDWVFAAGATNVEYHLRVTDTASGAVWTSDNTLGHLSQAGADTSAFACN